MTDVFLSYKREDKAQAKGVAEALARRGLDVWWDVDLLPGDRFADEIAAVIERAKVAVVLWSAASVASPWVRAEARLALERGILVPARLDASSLPLPYNDLHTEDLTGWDGRADSAVLAPLVEAAAKRAGVAPAIASPAAADAHLRSNDDEAKVWETVRTRQPQSADEYRLYLKRYPAGLFVEIAEARIAELSRPKRASPMKIVAAATAVVALVGGVFGVVAKWPEVEAVLVGWGLLSASTAEAEPPPPERPSEGEPRDVADRFADLAVFRDTLADGSDCAFCPEMVVIPRGTFTMGSPPDEAWRRDSEGPQRSVTVQRFAIGQFPITVERFSAFVSRTGHEAPGCGVLTGSQWSFDAERSWRSPGFEQAPEHPVACVSWDDARAYVTWLGEMTGERYRLPSEAEWEFAARAGTTTRYAFENDIDGSQANFGRNVGGTTPVGAYRANGWGLYDMHGNVWEWIEDCWHPNYTGAPSDGSAWLAGGGGDCSRRVLRGGSWDAGPDGLRSAYRNSLVRVGRSGSGGFRVARTLTP